jgi:hypothetical protein
MPVRRWWDDRPEQRFWLESTDRPDIGSDLRAPLTDDAGRDNWRYTLFREAVPGDLVFHYDKKQSAITGASSIAGPPTEAPIVWAARGTYARERGARPVEVPGYRIPLDDHIELAAPLSLEELRSQRPAIQAIHDTLLSATGGPLFFPFELSERPLRLLQGYAFKLPAEVVHALAPLRAAAVSSRDPLPQAPPTDALAIFGAAVAAVEAAAPAYAFGKLQEIRTRTRGLQRTARSIFGSRLKGEDWTFHHGGRDELQFNIGVDFLPDGAEGLRAGVAFSFEPSRSLPDIDILLPKVARFNAWLREHPEAFGDLAMWHWQNGVRSPNYAPGPVAETLVRQGTFVFLGQQQRLQTFDAHSVLRTFDRLLPLYQWVEAADDAAGESAASRELPAEVLRLDAAREIDGGRWITASTREQMLDVYLLHKEMQRRLKAQLLAEGCDEVFLEVPVGQRAIDAVAKRGSEIRFYEVKTAPTVRGCLREAIGQLLEYSLWPGATRPHQLIVVGRPNLDDRASAYLAALNKAFPIPLKYRQLPLEVGA